LVECSEDKVFDKLPELKNPESVGGRKIAKFQPSGQGEANLIYKLTPDGGTEEEYMLVLNYKRDIDDEIDDDTGKPTGRKIHVLSEVGGYVRISQA